MARIQVEGEGKATAAPDEIELFLTVGSVLPEYGQVIADLDRKVSGLKDEFVACGVVRTSIKTHDFSVKGEYVYDDGRTQRFTGYRAHHQMVLSFPLNRGLLNALLAVCPESEATPDIDIRFKVRNSDELQRQALEAAFAAAKNSAELLARSSGCELGDLVEVLYGERRHPTTLSYCINQEWGHVDYCRLSYADEIEPKEIENSEKVSVTWELRI
jgi:uncharacterized protein YggE